MADEVKDIRKTPYAEWLEEMCKSVMEYKPEKMGICMVMEDGTVLTGYYGELYPQDKAMMAYHMNTDAIFDTIKVNAKMILDAAEEQEENPDAEPDDD